MYLSDKEVKEKLEEFKNNNQITSRFAILHDLVDHLLEVCNQQQFEIDSLKSELKYMQNPNICRCGCDD